MSSASILVTGAGGMLGSALLREWGDRYQVTAAAHASPLHWPRVWTGDLCAPDTAARLVDLAAPDLVVHAAALTDVDRCEADPAEAMRVNAAATGALAAAARAAGAGFVYISTHAVFDGERGAYSEADAPQPVNQYAQSKLAGEYEALAAHPGALVLRLALEGWRPKGRPGFVQWVVQQLRDDTRATICTDWVHTLAFAPNVAEVIERLWRARACGVFHAGAAEPASNWVIAGAAAAEFGLDASLLVPITSDALRLPARRPKNATLVSDRLRAVIGDVVWSLPRGIADMRRREASGELTVLRELVGA